MKKEILILFLAICVFFTLSSVCAGDANDTIVASDDNQVELSQDVIDDNLKSNEIDEIMTESPKTFSSLNDTINGNDDSDIYLDGNYTFESGSDDDFKKGITIDRAVNVYGNGHVIDGANQSRIFKVRNSSVVFHDIIFQNAYGESQHDYGVAIEGPATAMNCTFIKNYANGGASKGGAMYGGNAIDCIFIENKAGEDGGAIYECNATNCVFLSNDAAFDGGAARESNTISCIFLGNTGRFGGATYKGNAINCIFLSNSARESGDDYKDTTVENCSFINSATLNASDLTTVAPSGEKQMITVPYSGEKQMIALTGENGEVLNRVPVTVDILVNVNVIGTYYGLSGDGWVVNLGPGHYLAMFYVHGANVAADLIYIKVSSGTSFVDLDYLINKKYSDNSTIYLDKNYAYDDTTVFEGIVIDRNLTIDGNGHTLDGNDLARIFHVTSGAVVTFNNITFTNGYAEGKESGGAIYAELGCTVKAMHCEFRNNTAYYGGAVAQIDCYDCYFDSNKAVGGDGYAVGGAFYYGHAENCIFRNNEAKNMGGAINLGYAVNSTFIGNKANHGGAIGEGYAINCTFESNNATLYGGAIYVCDAEGCDFKQNIAYYDGGAIYDGGAVNSTFMGNKAIRNGGAIEGGNATNCTFKRNTATDGGAIHMGNADNCTFENNSAYENGGAIYDGGAMNSAFSDNTAYDNGGAIYDGSAYNSNFTGNKADAGGAIYDGNATDCIFTQNTAYGEGGAIHGDHIWDYYGIAINCIFNNNTAEYAGGAMAYGDAINCSFTGNDVNIGNGTAMYGKSDYPCNALNCVFTDNNADKEVIKYGVADSCIFNGDTPGADVVAIKPDLSIPTFFISTYNDGSVFVVNITSASGMPITDARIKADVYTITGTFIGTYNISSSGWEVPFDAGNYYATYDATDYGGDTVQGIIVVNKDKTAVTSNAVSTVYNKDKYLVITLKDSKGNAMSGESVTVALGSAKTYKTDKNGQIKINVAKLVPKTYTAKISFAGNANYLASSTTVKVVVKKANPKLTAKAKTFKKKVKIKKYSVVLKDNLNKAIKNTKVTLKIKKKTYTAKTNKKGVAIFKIKKLTKKGTYKATVTFNGDAYYNKVAKKFKIKIK